MKRSKSVPDWAKHSAEKIWDELELAPDEKSACGLLFSLLYAFHVSATVTVKLPLWCLPTYSSNLLKSWPRAMPIDDA
jgi:hypothetical protein